MYVLSFSSKPKNGILLSVISKLFIFVIMKTILFRQKRLEIMIHVISWLLIFIFPIMLTEWGNKVDWSQCWRDSIMPLCCFIVFYINYLYLIPKCLFRSNGGRFLLLNAVLIVIMTSGLHYVHEQFLNPFRPEFAAGFKPLPPPPRGWMFLGRHLVMMTFVVGLSTAIRVSLRWRCMEERLVEAEREKTEAELKNLKNQLRPHFLLNTLNNIYSLIAIDGHRAQEAVQELSKMLRYVLYDNQSSKVSLAKELDFINNYISLMRIRLSESVKVSVHLDAGKEPILISPLIFISLIENAFKHGVSPTEESFISISISGHSDGRVTCEILNSNFPKNGNDKSGNGIGLIQVRRRLDFAYPGRYEWEKGTSNDNNMYISTLTIQTSEL